MLIVCVDCLRADHVSDSVTETPFFDTLRANGLEATACHATATTTSPCVASLLTGTYSERNGVHSLDTGRLSADVDSFAEVFGNVGYHTEALVTGPLVEETGLDRGFDRYRYREPEQSLFTAWRDTAAKRLQTLPEPFAVFLHLWEIHEDIEVPNSFDRDRYGETPYARAVSALDRELENLLECVPENTLTVLHGDHGESITHRHSPLRLGLKSVRDALRYYGGVDTREPVRRLNRRWGDRGADVLDHYIENGHGENVFDFVTNVPFVVDGPGVESETVDAQVRQIDILPTLVDLADIEATLEIDGESLSPVDSVTDRPAYLRACGASLHRRRNWARAVRADGWKYVMYPDRDWEAELYDISADPAELSPVSDDARAERLKRHFPDESLEDGEQLDVEDRLEKLGYR